MIATASVGLVSGVAYVTAALLALVYDWDRLHYHMTPLPKPNMADANRKWCWTCICKTRDVASGCFIFCSGIVEFESAGGAIFQDDIPKPEVATGAYSNTCMHA
jgi:hypothetical protein